ncbi:hypothetical protein CWIS_16290 [Cellulomonas sp. A375-1]|nr:hypothetical protein CWIS_16290 [Cellulomonas sp. A375-1]
MRRWSGTSGAKALRLTAPRRHPVGTHEAKERPRMAAMKPRTGDGPLEVTKEGRGIVMRVPLEGGGRLVVELNATEAAELGEALTSVAG